MGVGNSELDFVDWGIKTLHKNDVTRQNYAIKDFTKRLREKMILH